MSELEQSILSRGSSLDDEAGCLCLYKPGWCEGEHHAAEGAVLPADKAVCGALDEAVGGSSGARGGSCVGSVLFCHVATDKHVAWLSCISIFAAHTGML